MNEISFKDGILKINGKEIENYPLIKKQGKYYIDMKQVLLSLEDK